MRIYRGLESKKLYEIKSLKIYVKE